MKGGSNKKFLAGALMMVCFAAVLVLLFLPLFEGKNSLDYLDNLYNSISKGSAYYIPKVKQESQKFVGKTVDLNLALADAREANLSAAILKAAGAQVSQSGTTLKVKADMGKILSSCLNDSDDLFHNQGEKIAKRYGKNERLVLFTWWQTLKALEKDLNRQKLFVMAKIVKTAQAKAVECAYNFYKIKPLNIGDRWGIVLFSLVFYVIYTVWYGFSVMFMFEGAGFRLGH